MNILCRVLFILEKKLIAISEWQGSITDFLWECTKSRDAMSIF